MPTHFCASPPVIPTRTWCCPGRIVRIATALLLFFGAATAQAWNAAGHRLTTALAWQHMDPGTRLRVVTLLRQHPDAGRWLKRQLEADPDYGLFQEASTWADEIRRDPRFHDADEPPTARLAGFPNMLRQQQWHYGEAAKPGQSRARGSIATSLEQLAHDLAQGSQATQVYALPWLLHLVADIHQPLHTGGRNDRGGNAFEIENPYNPKKPFMSLHAYWDGLPGPSWMRGRQLARALVPLAVLPPPAQGNPAAWLAESRALIDQAYPTTHGSLLPLVTPEFEHQSRQLAQARLAAAGVRLGRWLNQLLPGTHTVR